MKKRIILGMISFSLASGFLVFGKPKASKDYDESFELCSIDCCESNMSDTDQKCCQPTELRCE